MRSGFITQSVRNYSERYKYEISANIPQGLNCYARRPHPKKRERTVFHWREMCDAVQAETYTIDDVEVSNFVLPLYFTPASERTRRGRLGGATATRAPGRPVA